MKRIYLYFIIGIAVVGTAGYFILSGSASKDPKYRTDKVTRGSVAVQVRATGTINPVQTVQVGSQVSGTIAKIFVDFNSEVKKGQLIAVIDSTLLYASVAEAKANVQKNQAEMNQADRNLTRIRELFKKSLVAQADLDAAVTAYESAAAQLKQTAAALDRAKLNLSYAIIRAPIDGVVISRDVDPGQTVAASLQTPKLFSIANDLKQMQVEASVDEADIGQIRTGQRVSFTVDSYPDEQFRGKVAQVRLAPVTVQNVVTYTVIIEVPNPDMKLRPGMTATVSILIDRRDDVLRVPTLAIRFQPPQDVAEKSQPAADPKDSSAQRQDFKMKWRQRGGGPSDETRSGEGQKFSRIWILDGNKAIRGISVTTGLNDNRFVEVSGEGFKEGDDVVIGMSAETASGPNAQTNPFQPRPMGGPGGGRRGM